MFVCVYVCVCAREGGAGLSTWSSYAFFSFAYRTASASAFFIHLATSALESAAYCSLITCMSAALSSYPPSLFTSSRTAMAYLMFTKHKYVVGEHVAQHSERPTTRKWSCVAKHYTNAFPPVHGMWEDLIVRRGQPTRRVHMHTKTHGASYSMSALLGGDGSAARFPEAPFPTVEPFLLPLPEPFAFCFFDFFFSLRSRAASLISFGCLLPDALGFSRNLTIAVITSL